MTNMAKYRLAGELPTTITSKLLYLVLLDITGADGKIVISQKKISEALGISHGTVSRNMHHLKVAQGISL
jgi:biotin operon repressor